ncbi:hypothetical protein TNCV_2579721 [Trichonephila clavipes]|uniref:Uncharacterized protein n=1 Tax=Trichonephila clavipes TaxID=2585209 RepID=A0A8X6VJ63_TRICX|nr:hypothetical protein TNCV_2579721 [Trichonephila clavipes]
MIQCIAEEPDEYIVAGTKELHLENCFLDVNEDNACTPLKETDPGCSAEEQPIPGWLCGASRYFPVTPSTLMRMFTNALSDLGTCQLLDGLRR